MKMWRLNNATDPLAGSRSLEVHCEHDAESRSYGKDPIRLLCNVDGQTPALCFQYLLGCDSSVTNGSAQLRE